MAVQPDDVKKLTPKEQLIVGLLYLYDTTEEICELAEAFDLVCQGREDLKKNKIFMQIKHIISNELIMNLGKLFSKGYNNDTISLYAYNAVENNKWKSEIEHLESKYDNYKEIRDKRLGHLDAIIIKEMEGAIIDLNEIELFLKEIKDFLKKAIPNYKDYFELYDFEEERDNIEAQLKQLFKQ